MKNISIEKKYELFKPLHVPEMEDVRRYAEYLYLTDVNKNQGERDELIQTIVSDSNISDTDAAALIIAVCVLEERSDEYLLTFFEHPIQERAHDFISNIEEVNKTLASYGTDPITPLPSWASRRPYKHAMRSRIAHHYMEIFGYPDDGWMSEEFDRKLMPIEQFAYNLILTDEEATSLMTALWIIDGGEKLDVVMKWPLRECVKDRIRYFVNDPACAERIGLEYSALGRALHEKA